MKKLSLVCILLAALLNSVADAQPLPSTITKSKAEEKIPFKISLFWESLTDTAGQNGKASGAKLISLKLDRKKLTELVFQENDLFEINIPSGEKQALELELHPVTFLAPDFKTYTMSGLDRKELPLPEMRFFRGHIKGDTDSRVSFSIVNGEISGLIADREGNRVLGRRRGQDIPDENYTLFYDMDPPAAFSCGTDSLHVKSNNSHKKNTDIADNATCKWAGIYIETGKDFFDIFGNASQVQTYVLNLFNQVANVYSAEDIAIRMTELQIWTTPDPYSDKGSTEFLKSFRAYWNNKDNSYNGNIAHLIKKGGGGGEAYLTTNLCDKTALYGLSVLAGHNADYPYWSQDLYAMSHELGHNFGSPHNRSCTWPGGPIDNCGTVEDGPCASGPDPVAGGTIMGRCFGGKAISNGFGPLPGELIRSRFRNADCLPIAKTVPTGLSTEDIYANSTGLKWNYVGSNSRHTIQYRLQGGDKWTEIQTKRNRLRVPGLLANTQYEWRVSGDCSDFTEIQVFSTNNLAPVYCKPPGDCQTWNDNIQSVSVNDFQLSKNSGCSPGGYQFYTNISPPVLVTGTLGALEIGLSSGQSQFVTAWIDYNYDGEFMSDEIIYDNGAAVSNVIDATFSVPSGISQVTTRMRVRTSIVSAVLGCGDTDGGETEDYPVVISDTPSPVSLEGAVPYPNPSIGDVIKITAAEDALVYLYTISGHFVPVTKRFINKELTEILPNQHLIPGIYILKIGEAVYKVAVR